jgi:glycosyltransferase involved in cell wall biosynthesis
MAVEVVAYNDGSTDESLAILEEMAAREPSLRVVSHANRGHGPTLLRGYLEAKGEWVFQVDSDGELGAGAFESLWRQREDFDFLLGHREGRRSSPARLAVTLMSRAVVATLFGRAIRDVNSPYRLMRRTSLQELLVDLPGEPFAPNVLLSGLAGRKGLRIREVPVDHQSRRGGTVSLTSGKLARGAFRTFCQALEMNRRVRRGTS